MIVHTAGPALTVRYHVRQRCSWCGTVLLDEDLTRVAVPVTDAGRPFPTWPPDALVVRDGASSYTIEPKWHDLAPGQPETERAWRVPDGACFALPPEMTLTASNPEERR